MFAIVIAISNKNLAGRWRRSFQKQNFCAFEVDGIETFHVPREFKGLILAEIGTKGVETPEELKTWILKNGVPVILSGKKGGVSDEKITSFLYAGADDFIDRDINEKLLSAKIHSHLRRLLPSLTCAKTVIASKNGEIELDRLKNTATLTAKGGKRETLDNFTSTEFEILCVLIGCEGEVVERRTLMEQIWKEKTGTVNCETVDKHVENIRRKLKETGKNIKTIYGHGYMYTAVEISRKT